MKTSAICFGLDPENDKRSLILFLQKFAQPALLETVINRCDAKDISSVLDLISNLMRKHLNDQEYHRLFLDN